MNKTGRKTLLDAQDMICKALDLLTDAKDSIEGLAEEEHDKYDNAPESLQDSDTYQTISDNADTLDSLAESIGDVIDTVDDLSVDEGFDL